MRPWKLHCCSRHVRKSLQAGNGHERTYIQVSLCATLL
jgi:hypothetical protein